MTFKASLNVEFTSGEDTYKVVLDIPSAAPSDADPFVFTVMQAGATPTDPGDTLLELAVGGTPSGADAETNVMLELSPPTKLLEDATESNLHKAALSVQNGSKTFTDGAFA